MRTRYRGARRIATLVALPAVLLAGLALGAAPAAASENPQRLDLSSEAKIRNYLTAAGYDGAGALVQTGLNNYAGANCPGAGWTCAKPAAGRAVIQITSGVGQNKFEGAGTTCVVVQRATGGANAASCTQKTTKTGAVADAFITQENVNAGNSANVNQNSTVAGGTSQTAEQHSAVHQEIEPAGTGSNSTVTFQRIFESVDSGTAQNQLSMQKQRLTQLAALGDNTADVDQQLTQRENASGGNITQSQNPNGTEQYIQSKVDQHGEGATDNNATIDQSTDQQQVVNPASGAVTQTQGCGKCGIIAAVHQVTTATGSNLAVENQTERQHQVANGATSLVQKQIGPITDPPDDGVNVPGPVNGVRCCSDQEGSANSQMTLTQRSTQNADAADPHQDNFVFGSCHSAGNCNVSQTVSNNDGTFTNSCSGPDCGVAIQCLEDTACQSADTDDPETTLVSTPPNPSASSSATFTFTSNEPGGFLCMLDGGAFEQCSSPKTYTGLADGEHHIHVHAVDLAGNVDDSPAEYTWTIDTSAPDTVIDSGPADLTSSRTATFTYHATEATNDFECSLDGGAFADCDGGTVTYTGLADGAHTFAVRARDALGNVDPSPATDAWTVDGTAPTSAFTTPNNATVCGDPPCNIFPLAPTTVNGTAGDNLSGVDRVEVTWNRLGLPPMTVQATLTCNPSKTSCTWSADVPPIPPGQATVTQQAFDEAGNAGTPTTITVTIV